MEGNSWRPVQGEPPAPPDGGSTDWRIHLQPDARQRIVNQIMDTFKRHLPISGSEGLSELQKIAIRFEEGIYSTASCQSDYLRKISLKLRLMENESQHSATISNNKVINQNSSDPATLDSTAAQSGHVGVVDLQEEICQKVVKLLLLTD